MSIDQNEAILKSWRSASVPVKQAIQQASEQTGVDFSYLMSKAKQESSFQANATAKSSSATGLYQFLEGTWLETVKNHGDKYGLGDYAAAITQSSSGELSVANEEVESQILELRKDPYYSAVMAAEYTKSNEQILQKTVGKEVSNTDLYMAHFLGAGGASRFISELDKDGSQSAAALFPSAARANKAVFYEKNGTEKSLDEVYSHFSHQLNEDVNVLFSQAIVEKNNQVSDDHLGILYSSLEEYSNAKNKEPSSAQQRSSSPAGQELFAEIPQEISTNNFLLAQIFNGLKEEV